jgi:cleavage and polyadenylation specificity factor subunit 2
LGAPRYRMFPFVEKKRRTDDFGEIIDVSSWLRKGKILDAKLEKEDDKPKSVNAKAVEEQKKVNIFTRLTLTSLTDEILGT